MASSLTSPTARHIASPTATPSQPTSSIILTSGSSIYIRAPAYLVFSTILETPSYSLWNKWSPSLTFSSSTQSLSVPGSIGVLKCEMGPGKFYDVPVKVLDVTEVGTDASTKESKDVYELKWQGQMLPQWFGMAERVQRVARVRGDRGEEECEVTQWESMSGWGVYLLKWVMGVESQLKKGNLQYVEDLKAWCEKQNNIGG